MNKLLSADLWPYVKKLARKAGAKKAAVAYVTSEECLRLGDGDLLVTDASDGAIKSGQTSAKVLAGAKDRGAHIYSLPGLHAKLLLIDGVAVIGSANASDSSAHNLIEAAWATDQPTAVAMVSNLIEELVQSAQEVDGRFLKRINALPVQRRHFVPGTRKTQRRPRTREPQAWIMGVWGLKKEFPDEEEAIESGEKKARETLSRKSSDVSWIRFTGRSRFRKLIKPGDTIVQIWREGIKERPYAVYRHSPVRHVQEEPNCTRVFVEDFANAEKTTLPWGKFLRLTKRVGLGDNIGPNSGRSITQGQSEALFNLWDV